MSAKSHTVSAQEPVAYSPIAKGESAREDHRPRQLWAPFFLRRPAMVGFLISYLSLLGAVIALYVYSERQNHTLGIKTKGNKYYYLWTYGPTAVFTIITAGWVQAEYRAAQLMPWILMLNGPTAASQSILLDYVSKWNVISLYQSIRQRHFLVSLCVAGSLLLNGITVVSTGLFELESVRVVEPVDLMVLNRFGGANYNPMISDARAFAACMAFSSRNMTRPTGIHQEYVYTPFLPADVYSTKNDSLPTGRIYQADIEVIKPYFDCQNATVSWEPSEFTINETTPLYKAPDGCQSSHLGSTPLVMRKNMVNLTGDDYYRVNVGVEYQGCHGETSNDSYIVTSPSANHWDIGWRVWATVASIENSTSVTSPPKDPYVAVCTPRYAAYRGPVKVWRDSSESAVSADIKSDTLNVTSGIAGVQASKLMLSAYKSASIGRGLEIGSTPPFASEYVFAANGTPWEQFVKNTTFFTDTITASSSCMMQQVVKNSLLQDAPHQINGTVEFDEDRLFVRQMSFWLISALFVILIGVVLILLCFFVPVAVCPHDTGSIGGVATILSQSPEFMAGFQKSQFESEAQMEKSMPGQTTYSTSSNDKGAFMLLPQDRSIPQTTGSSDDEVSSPTWWHPLSSTWFIRIAVVAVPLAVIISLEVVYHISTGQRGITLIDGKSPYAHYAWAYIPALLMFIIRCLFTTVESGVRIIQPYTTLRKGHAPPETSISENQLRKFGVYQVLDTIRKKQWALTGAATALLLATINPIIVSGLFTSRVSGPTSPINLAQTTRWNLGYPNDLSQKMSWWERKGFEDFTPGLILSLNLSDPQWTHNNLAFPHFKINTTSPPKDGSIDVRIPALRSGLTCAQDPANGDCSFQGGNWQCQPRSTRSLCFNPLRPSNISKTDYFLTSGSRVSNFFIESGNSMLDKSPSNCSTYNLLYGKWKPNGIDPMEHHYFYCNTTIEEVDVDVKLQLPSLSIDTDSPPRVVESSVRKPFDTNSWSLPDFESVGSFNLFDGDPKYKDALMEALAQGVNGVPLNQLLNPEKLIQRLQVVYGIVVAQLLNNNARESFDNPINETDFVEPATMKAPIYTGDYQDGRKYLVQNKLSTRLLESVLAAMVVCALIALCMMQTKGILPKSPTSIAAVASFLYGSQILDSVLARGTEWGSEKEQKKGGVFEGHTFSMGWWKNESQGRFSESPASGDSAASRHSAVSRDSVGSTLSVASEGPVSVSGSAASRESGISSASDDSASEASEPDGGQISNQRFRFGIDVDNAERPLLRHPGEA